MEAATTLVSIVLLICLVVCPLIIIGSLKRRAFRHVFITYLIVAIAVTAVIMMAFAWWTDIANRLLLAHYGYNLDGMNSAETYGQVSPENLERVRSLERSTMGIGWPLKAIVMFLAYSPYLLVVYLVMKYLGRSAVKRNS